jgi:hypothetical protein
MFINLAWTNVNSGAVTTNIYRGTAELDRKNLGTPLVTLTNGETTYKDTNVTLGTTYYYVIEFVSAGVRTSTRNYPMVAQYVRGHGNPTVVLGNDAYGFIDSVSFGRTVSLLTQLGMPTAGIADNALPAGLKFSYNGKVVVAIPITTSLIASSYNSFGSLLNNNAGLPVSFDGFNYLVRLPKGMPSSWDNASRPTTGDYDTDFIKLCLCHFNQLAPMDGETLGKLGNQNKSIAIICRETNAGYVNGRTPSTGAITWYPVGNAVTGITIFLLELVE